ncbi:hypothetical protein KAJ83_13615 [Marivibrio halodurans]|uniref:Uncharacterized protein n=1 Tax=Marivibrio halodurans TaxID=2039722 RepID=A0A8J7SP17_9PROT|nr:hypothetical protein [Marivibrio halodurans]MBP5858051.1 hypothetical protein [Marivibrio halodurans]
MRTGSTLPGWAVLAFALALLPALIGLPGSASAGGETPTFIEGSEDIPLMETLAGVPDAGIVFDSPAGRIVEAFAAGPTNREAVLAFYGETLPALGWTARGRDRFTREGEQLSLDFFGPDGDLTVRFTLAPI